MKARPVNPQLNRQILDEASGWFVDFRVGDADPAARARFDQWLRASPEHIRAYMEIARTYVELPVLAPNQKIDVDALIARARSDANVLQLREAAPTLAAAPRLRPPRWQLAVAASILVAILGVSAYVWLAAQRYPTYTTEIGESRQITLADGSTVDLNARSRLRIEFSSTERDVELLDGQALFGVAHDPARPFIVRSGGAVVRAVGTQFDVYRRSAGTTVTVVEGRVAVGDTVLASDAPGALLVSAGEQVTVTAQAITKPRHTDVTAATAWTRHRLIFDGTPLSEVVENFNRYNARQLIIEDPALADFHVSGVYASTDPASLIRFLKEQPGVLVTESADAVRIGRR
jgi:transmembrane sensor